MSSKVGTADMLRSLVKDLSDKNATVASSQTLVTSRTAQNMNKALMGVGTTPETEAEIQKLQSALAFLSPDTMRGQGKLYEPGDTKPSDHCQQPA